MDRLASEPETRETEARTNVWRSFLPPLLVLSGFLLAAVILRFSTSTSPDELLNSVVKVIGEHGYWPVAVAAIIEAVPGMNLYLPGSGVILLAVASARQTGSLSPAGIWLIASLCFTLVNALNYMAGRFGWLHLFRVFRLERFLNPSTKEQKNLIRWVALSCFHPNASAITATTCGIQRVDFWRFMIVLSVATFIWNAAWTLVAYLAAPYMDQLLTTPVILSVIAVWIVVISIRTLVLQRSGRAGTE